MNDYHLDRIAEDYYLFEDSEPQFYWGSYIGRLVRKDEHYYYFYFSNSFCIEMRTENDFLRARKATWREVYAAVKRETGAIFGLCPLFLKRVDLKQSWKQIGF